MFMSTYVTSLRFRFNISLALSHLICMMHIVDNIHLLHSWELGYHLIHNKYIATSEKQLDEK